MNKMHFLTSICLCLIFSSYSQNNYTSFVNPFIGTGGHGHTYPGATLPHGMVQLSPDTRLEGWDGCSGYHYSDSFIYGFSHTHLSGTGCSDYGDILLIPGNGAPSPNNKVYGSSFLHQNEKASPGYYSVSLDKYNIQVELTATERVGIHRYRFLKQKDSYVMLDLKHRDEVLESYFKIEDSITITGMRRSKAWAEDQVVYFVMKFSKPFTNIKIWQNDIEDLVSKKDEYNGKSLKAAFLFNDLPNNELSVQVAISPVSVEGAKKNLATEASGKSFVQLKNEATKKWNKELSKIEISDKDIDRKTIFYTALYHTAIVPNINMDVDGRYRGRDGKIHHADGFDYYSVFSLWDTYRAAHPLYAIIDRKRTLDYIKTFLAQYQQVGLLPVWELSSNETNCMIGYHSIPVIVDAYMKGIRDFDLKLALEAMMASANEKKTGVQAIQQKGLISVEDDHESVSKTLEYAYDDYCIALFAKEIGNDAIYQSFLKRALSYKNLLDPETHCMRPRKNGGWLWPFDPREVNNHFTEANSWQYSFYVPQDINGLTKELGGVDKLEAQLDALFNASSKTTGREQSDITGLIGQYAHGNEPSHHIAYLYNYTNHPHKAQYYTHKIMNEFYTVQPDGLIGNEDCGQMSAWYVWSSMGLYPVTPGANSYVFGSPLFDQMKINLENGKTFQFNTIKKNKQSKYIESVYWQKDQNKDKQYFSSPILYDSAWKQGGYLYFTLTDQKMDCFKQPAIQNLVSKQEKISFVVNPVISGKSMSFDAAQEIVISSPQKNVRLLYSLDGNVPDEHSSLYVRPFMIDSTVKINAIAIDEYGNKSLISQASFRRLKKHQQIQLNSKYMKSYDGGGDQALVDELYGYENWRMGGWQGYQEVNPECIVDLKEVKELDKVRVGFLQDTRSWIIMPKSVKIFLSEDGKQFAQVYSSENFVPVDDMNVQIKRVDAHFPPQKARYIKVLATQYGKLPDWHPGAGGDSIIFMDEVEAD